MLRVCQQQLLSQVDTAGNTEWKEKKLGRVVEEGQSPDLKENGRRKKSIKSQDRIIQTLSLGSSNCLNFSAQANVWFSITHLRTSCAATCSMSHLRSSCYFFINTITCQFLIRMSRLNADCHIKMSTKCRNTISLHAYASSYYYLL